RIDVARLAAAEAVVVAELRTHVEARAALVVERAEALERADPGRLQAHMLADDVGDVGAGLHLFDVALSNPARHGPHPSSPVELGGRGPARTTGTAARTRRGRTGR